MEVKDALALAYFQKFIVRVEILEEFQKREAYSDVIREGQEALELMIRGLLRISGREPLFSHDPGKELNGLENQVPAAFRPHLIELREWSKQLRKERELSFYGAADFIPTLEYSEEDGQRVIVFLKKISSTLKKFLKS